MVIRSPREGRVGWASIAPMTYTLILLRHGESEWNALNLFTGWVDVNLTAKGEAEAVRGGQMLPEPGILPDVAQPPLQKRAIRAPPLALATLERHQGPGVRGGWSGWLGFERDRRLCGRIRERTGIVATTAVLALNELLALKGLTTLALVTPYTQDVQQRIVENYRGIGIEVVAERHLGIRVNYDFATVQPQALLALMREVAADKPQAITTFCTNLRAAPMAAQVERELGIPLLDTVSTTVWGMLRAAGVSPAQVRGWGELFQWT